MSQSLRCEKARPAVWLGALLMLGFLTGCPIMAGYSDADGPRYSGDFRPVQPVAVEDPSSVTVVTYNLAFAEQVTEAVASLSSPPLSEADVIAMQEMDAPAVERIARELGMSYVYYPASVAKDGDDFGNAVLSRWPITADQKINLPHDDPYHQQHRIGVAATVDIRGTPFQVVSVHGATPIVGLGARLDQAETVIQAVDGAAQSQVIAGDFNTSDPGSLTQTVKLFSQWGFQWASEGVGDTVDSVIGGLPLDSVFARGLTPVARGVDKRPSGSDHQPVWVRFAWPQ
ncbi:endonuclease/exonuclease/phosphatase family protein [Corallococcus exiguus]|nr:endonuclease [Corallococcus exiguus]NRD53914.1 endonuclease/exonuclease/phosphatase family protein [Corallococcus exiguus]NRD66848.1 endonuclease/exonuclease/phosphatase family protein [Corallococcus exiguus]RKH22668.1 endonuclease [Corallococcus sp. CA041A]RKI05991.1 endonuclease [Corallococcus sp. AB030]